jgi:hypothetical protein
MTSTHADALPAARPFADAGKLEKIRSQMLSPWTMRLFMLKGLPLGFIAGLRVRELDAAHCVTSVPYRWLTTNPFRSTYFAAQSMAAELSTGALGMLAVEAAPGKVAMLIVDLQASFGKKATNTAFFTCVDGAKIFEAVRQTCETGAPATATVETVGRMADGTEVSRFAFTWSFKKRAGT